jgi:hypothetical protein
VALDDVTGSPEALPEAFCERATNLGATVDLLNWCLDTAADQGSWVRQTAVSTDVPSYPNALHCVAGLRKGGLNNC